MAILPSTRRTQAQAAQAIEAAGMLRRELNQTRAELAHMNEAADSHLASLAREDSTWSRLGELHDGATFDRAELGLIARRCHVYASANPLIKRAVTQRAAWVFSQGFSIEARHPGDDGKSQRFPAGEDVINRFVRDAGNRRAVFGDQALQENNIRLDVDGNRFLTIAASEVDGDVKVRPLPFEQMNQVITDPDDATTPWFYRRVWRRPTASVHGGDLADYELRDELYPAVTHPGYGLPGGIPGGYGGLPVQTRSPVRHIRTIGLGAGLFGLPDMFAALDWARAYREFLEDWASLTRALMTFAWRMGGLPPGSTGAAAARLGSTIGPNTFTREGNPPPAAGAALTLQEGVTMEAIPKSGATIDADSGKPIRLMVAAGVDLPDHILSMDPQQGALATARSLDRPTELTMGNRQNVWGETFEDLGLIAIRTAATAPAGRLRGQLDVRLLPELTVEVNWGPLVEHDVPGLMNALVKAATIQGVDPLIILRHVYALLGEDDIDEKVADAEKRIAEGEPIPDPTGIDDMEGVEEALDRIGTRLVELAASV